jgi:hypothetical protein
VPENLPFIADAIGRTSTADWPAGERDVDGRRGWHARTIAIRSAPRAALIIATRSALVEPGAVLLAWGIILPR